MAINAGRWMARLDEGAVLFRIGMRINRPWAVHRWLPVFGAMPGMLREQANDPDSGMLGYEQSFGPRTATVTQFWRSVDDLLGYAAGTRHRSAWLAFYRAGRSARGAVGIWHETYVLADQEALYVDMPPHGVGRVGTLAPVGRGTDRAAERMSTH